MPCLAIVEDDRYLAEILGAATNQAGWRCVQFWNVADALDHDKLKDFDLALVDVVTPRKDAFEFIAAMVERKLRIPIALTSVHWEYLRLAASLAQSHRIDLRCVLPKPITIDRFKKILSNFTQDQPHHPIASPNRILLEK